MVALGQIVSTSDIPNNSVNAESPGATVTISMSANATVRTWTAGQNEAVVISGTQLNGQLLIMRITCDALPRTLTWSTGLAPSAATFVLTALKVTTSVWLSDGSNFYMLTPPLTAL